MTQQAAVTNPPKKNNSTEHPRSNSSSRTRATNKTTQSVLTSVKSPSPPTSPASNKQATLIALMERPEGVSLTELMNLSGWQAHSVRGWISGTLRKKLGLVVCRFKSASGETCYRIQPVSAASITSTAHAVC